MTRAKKNPALKVAGVEFFTFKELSKATSQFSVNNEIGEGGYGKVYKATLEEKKKMVAIKRAQGESLQGAKEFYNEIEFMSRCHHRNLVKLVGYCDDEGEQVPCLSFWFRPSFSLPVLLIVILLARKSQKYPQCFVRNLYILVVG